VIKDTLKYFLTFYNRGSGKQMVCIVSVRIRQPAQTWPGIRMLTETNPPFTETANQHRRIQLSVLLH